MESIYLSEKQRNRLIEILNRTIALEEKHGSMYNVFEVRQMIDEIEDMTF